MKEIKLTQGMIALVDDEDFDYLNQWRWYVHKERYSYYALRSVKNSNKKTIAMHRIIMGTPDNMHTDHKDKNGLNNQKDNLRYCTNGQNQMNRKSSGKINYLGVNCVGKHFQSRISTERKRIYLGTFKTEKEAALAYNKAAIKYHGEFASLNII